MKSRLTTILAALAMICTSTALYADSVEIRLKSGSTWRGDSADTVEISFLNNGVPIEFRAKFERIEDLYVVVRELDGTNRQWTIFRADITSLKSVDDAADVDEEEVKRDDVDTSNAAVTKPAAAKADAYNDKSLGVFVLPLRGGVGETFRHDEVDMIGKEADKYGPGQIIVLEIESGGGLGIEMARLHESVIELKRRHRVVAWVKEAISAAAATAINCDEMYFRTDGTLGAMTGHVAGSEAPESIQQEALDNFRIWMEAGGRPGFIADPMVFARAELSYDIDPITGEVTWRPDAEGEFVLSNNRQNLVFTSSQAAHSKFADGIADTNAELADLLGLPTWHEKSPYGRELADDVEEIYERGSEEIPLLYARLTYKGAGISTLAVLQKRIQTLQDLMRWWDLHENLCYLNGVPPKEDLQRLIDATRQQIADMRGR